MKIASLQLGSAIIKVITLTNSSVIKETQASRQFLWPDYDKTYQNK